MSESPGVQPILDAATRAAASSDWTTAEKCLRLALRLQEVGLGPNHPELARTLGRLGSVCEVTLQLAEAEVCYRKACAIASVVRPPDAALLATTTENLRHFCAAHDIPLDN